MGTRKYHIMGKEREQIAIEMLPSYQPYGKVSQLAEKYKLSRQTLYTVNDYLMATAPAAGVSMQATSMPIQPAYLVNRRRL